VQELQVFPAIQEVTMTIKIHDVEEYKSDIANQDGEILRRERIEENTGVERRQNVSRLVQLIWLAFGALEVLIGMRILLRLIAANPNNPFARAVYDFSTLFLWPFESLTVSPAVNGIVLDIPALIALLVFTLIGMGLTQFLWIVLTRRNSRRVVVYERRPR
jgi:uncharacterized protein YggT (Ycf19 family)